MQKVEGSSPFIRSSESPAPAGFSRSRGLLERACAARADQPGSPYAPIGNLVLERVQSGYKDWRT